MADKSQYELGILIKAITDPSTQRMAQEIAVNLKVIVTGLRDVQKESNTTAGALQRMASGITGFLRDVAATAAGVLVRDLIKGGFERLKDAVEAAGEALIGANARFELLTTTITAMVGSQETAANMLEAIRQIAMETGRGFSEMVEMGQPLVRFAQGSSKALYGLMQAMMLLQAIKPQAGPVAAMIAITEALSGQFRSLQMRFEIGKEKIQAVLDEGYEGVEALLEVLKREGASWELVTAQANTFSGVMTTLKGVAQDFFRVMGSTVFGQVTGDLRSLRDWVIKNKDAIMGLAQAIGTYLAAAYDTAIALLTDLLGLEGGFQQLSVEGIVQWGANLIASLTDGILYAADQYLLPAITAIAKAIASLLSGGGVEESAKESGKKVVEGYAEGITEAGVPEKAKQAIAGVQKELTQGAKAVALQQTVEEAQRRGAAMVEAAQKRVAAAQEAVRRATERVREAQERLNAFTRATAEIPERFTRGRRRQLEVEIEAAQKEQQKRQDALSQIQDMLRATQEQARALEKLAKAQEEAAEEAKGFGVGMTGDLEKAGSKVDEFAQRFREMIAEAFAERDVGGRWKSIERQFETLGGSVKTITDNIWKIPDAIGKAAGFVGDMIDAFNNLPPWVQNVLKGVAIVIAINLATGGMVSALLTALAPLGIALATGPAAGVAALVVSIAVLFKVVEANKQELWTTFQQIYGIAAFGAVSLMPEGPTKEYLKKTFIQPMLETMDEANPFIEKQAKKTYYDTVERQLLALSEAAVGQSIVPDMIDDILDEYERLKDEILPIVERFVGDSVTEFEELAESIMGNLGEAVDFALEYNLLLDDSFREAALGVDVLRVAVERLSEALRVLPVIPQLPGFNPGSIRFPTARGGGVLPGSVAAAAGAPGGGGGARLNTFNINALINLQHGTKQEFLAAAERLWDEKMSGLSRRLNK